MNAALFAQIKRKQQPPQPHQNTNEPDTDIIKVAEAVAVAKKQSEKPTCPPSKIFHYDESFESFLFNTSSTQQKEPYFSNDANINSSTKNTITIPLAPCIYRLTDYTYTKKEPITKRNCILKLGVLRCFQRELHIFNKLLLYRLSPASSQNNNSNNSKKGALLLEEEELGKVRFMELLSNCGIYQKVSEMILQCVGKVADLIQQHRNNHNDSKIDDGVDSNNPFEIPQIEVKGLDDFLTTLRTLTPSLNKAAQEIVTTQTVSFYPGLGELFTPGSKLLCHPDGLEGIPVGCSCVQSWYAEEFNQATGKLKHRFILVVEFLVSVGDELVFVAASEVYPEFHDTSRNVPIKDLTHAKIGEDDYPLLERLQKRGEFYASVATKNHYLEYHPNSFFPIIKGGGWSNNALRPLSKGGRVMVDVKRGILENHIPVRSGLKTSTMDGMSDTVKEAIKLFEQSKRTGVAVPFRTAILPHLCDDSDGNEDEGFEDSDRHLLWQAWPMLTGFSFTARVWGKLLLTLSKPEQQPKPKKQIDAESSSPLKGFRQPSFKMGVALSGLGGVGKSGSCGYIKFQEHAFDQLVLHPEKKELIRAVARNTTSAKFDYDTDDSDDDSDDEMGLDVIANKGAASIFLLHGPPGCGKTLTAEAIAELLKKPLYVITAGDLGITANEVEKTLGSVLELCQTWDALVLIDEADVFLEARNSSEIQRNALVCVMLRLLEYYSGCLFLSSNRTTGSIDPAIASRITVMLEYPSLDVDGRAKVWTNLIQLIPTLPKTIKNPRKVSKYRQDFTQVEYYNLAMGYLLNGRQIKNSIVLARALARERGVPLSLDILKRAVTAVAGETSILPSV